MPYIKPERRPAKTLEGLASVIENGGELNYCFTKLCVEFIRRKGESYTRWAECISALEGAKQEIYRRFIVPYEDKKLDENGDIF